MTTTLTDRVTASAKGSNQSFGSVLQAGTFDQEAAEILDAAVRELASLRETLEDSDEAPDLQELKDAIDHVGEHFGKALVGSTLLTPQTTATLTEILIREALAKLLDQADAEEPTIHQVSGTVSATSNTLQEGEPQ